MNRRAMIELTSDEQRAFLEQAKTIVLSTLDRRGYPHAVAMWFTMMDGCCFMTTYAKSQKVKNVERHPKVALLAESGTTYDTLKGVLIRGRAELIHSVDECVKVLTRVHEKMMGSFPEGVEDALSAQARKRVVVKVTPIHVSSWDHSKLRGAY